MTPHQRLMDWANTVHTHRLPRYDDLPGIDLYMDQVVAVIDDYLRLYMRDSKDQHLTPAMINNYVKLKLVPAPVKKRYTRAHLCHLIIICMLKPVLAIPEIHELIRTQLENSDIRTVYDAFCTMQEESLRITLGNTTFPDEDDAAAFSTAALRIAVHANANKLIADRIIDAHTPEPPVKEKDKKKKE